MLLADFNFQYHSREWDFAARQLNDRFSVLIWKTTSNPPRFAVMRTDHGQMTDIWGTITEPLEAVEAQCVVYEITRGGDDAAR